MHASLPDTMIAPFSRSETLTLELIGRNMVEPSVPAPPVRQACSLTVNSSVMVSRPAFRRSNTM